MARKLTVKQEKFAQGLFTGLSQREAYKQAYNAEKMKDKSIDEKACELAANVKIKSRLEELTNELTERSMVTLEKVLADYVAIAASDIKDFLRFRTEKVVVGEDDEGNPISDYRQVIEMKPSEEVNGALIQEVSISAKGVFSFRLHDKMKALEVLAKHVGLLSDKHKQRIEEERLKLDQARFDMDKAKAAGGISDDVIDKHNERILTLAQLLNNPVPNRNIEDFEEDVESGES